MTLKEKIKVCSICKNRKFSAKEGLICGNTGAKPAFEDECHDFDLDITEQERQKKLAAEIAEETKRTGITYAGPGEDPISSIGVSIEVKAILFLLTFLIVLLCALDIIPISFFIMFFLVWGGVYFIYIKKKIRKNTFKEIYQKIKKTLPRDIGEEFSWTDITFNSDAIEYINVYHDGMTPEFGDCAEKEIAEKYLTEQMKAGILTARNQDPLFDFLAKTNKIGLRYKFFSPEGKLVLDLPVSNSEIKRVISQGEYSTKHSDFLSILESYNKLLPSELFLDGCKLCKCTLSKDGKTLHLDLKLYDLKLYGGDTFETLAELTPEYAKRHIMQDILSNVNDYAINLAVINNMNISFNYTSEDVSSWRLNVLIEPHEYNQILS